MLRKMWGCHSAWVLIVVLSAGAAPAAPEERETLPPSLPPPTDKEPKSALEPSKPRESGSDSRKLLDRPLESPPSPSEVSPVSQPPAQYPFDPPLGFTGRSSVLPLGIEGDGDFVPVEDRWRAGFPGWDRYGKGFPPVDDYPYQLGNWYNPYTQNVLKGDYPIIGQHTFLNITAVSTMLTDTRQVPTATTPFESTTRPFREEFFGSPNQLAYNQFLSVSFDLFHGDAAFKPMDWRVKVRPVFNANTLNVDELAVVNPDVTKGTQRDRSFFALEEYFVETKIADLSPNYDFVSARVGSQFFNNDFRGFLFSDTNRAVRIFGTSFANRDQFNLAFFRQAEKDTNSGLNTMEDRGQNVLLANYFHPDFLYPGYTIEASIAYNHDPASFMFDRNHVLVRPDPVGVFQPHTLDVVYLGLGSDGHIDRYNITSQLYWALGHDTLNPIAGQSQDINAFMAAVELSYDRDWARFRTSFFFSSGDHNANDHHATGFDSIFDNPNFAGGQFSFWQRQAIRLFGVNLVQENSLIPDLRSSKTQGQSNFVNPGLILVNFGVDFDLTPKLKMINNVNCLWFESTQVLKTFVYDSGIQNHIGTDLSTGFEYRPLLSNNIVMLFGVSTLLPGSGFKSLYDPKTSTVSPLVAAFVELNLAF